MKLKLQWTSFCRIINPENKMWLAIKRAATITHDFNEKRVPKSIPYACAMNETQRRTESTAKYRKASKGWSVKKYARLT